ncbi:MAG: hypothetical protein U0Y82_03040 [Thermoleophilia bacterium]
MNEPVDDAAETGQHSHLSRGIGFVFVGWLVVYNILRLRGDNPAEAWKPGLLVGGLLGLAAFGAAEVVGRRLSAAGRVAMRRRTVVSGTLDDRQADAVGLASKVLLGAAVVAAVVALIDLVHFASGSHALGMVVIILWNLVFAGWAADEALRMRRHQLDGLETVYFGSLLTAAMAGVALSRNIVQPAQVVLVLVAGVTGMALGLAGWRLGGGRGAPLATAAALVVTLATLALATLL